MNRVSVIIPAYNAARFLAEALESVLGQEGVTLDVIVVDDGSSDATAAVAETFGDRITLIRQANAGESVARNRGLKSCKGDWVAFLDADDALAPGALRLMVGAGEQDDAVGLVYGAVELFTPEGVTHLLASPEQAVDGTVLAAVICGHTLLPGQFVVRRDVGDRTGGFATDLRYGEDWDYVLRLVRATRCGRVPGVVLKKRVHRGMQSLDRDRPDIVTQRLAILHRVFGSEYVSQVQPLLTRPVLADWLRSFAFSYVESGAVGKARRVILRSLWQWPFQPALYLWLLNHTVVKPFTVRRDPPAHTQT